MLNEALISTHSRVRNVFDGVSSEEAPKTSVDDSIVSEKIQKNVDESIEEKLPDGYYNIDDILIKDSWLTQFGRMILSILAQKLKIFRSSAGNWSN